MIIYSVTIVIEAAIESQWLDWMQKIHVPDVLQTGCFTHASIYKIVDSGTDGPTYVIHYQCSSIEEYRRYAANFAPAIQKEHSQRFSGRFRASRALLKEVWQREKRT